MRFNLEEDHERLPYSTHFVVLLKFVFLVLAFANIVLISLCMIREDLFWKSTDLIRNDPEAVLDDSLRALDADFAGCVTDPSKIFCLVSANERLDMISGRKVRDAPEETYETRSSKRHPMHALLEDFGEVAQWAGVTPVLLEPSILFCMLSSEHKLLLLKRGLDLSALKGSERVLNLAVTEAEAQLLNEPDSMNKLQSVGFMANIVNMTRERWMNPEVISDVTSAHHIYARHQLLVHVVVFHARSNFLWHAELPVAHQQLQDLLFAEAASAYENFTAVPLPLYNDSVVYIPSNPRQFLFEMAASRFLECNESRLSGTPAPSSRALEKFRDKSVTAVREMKERFQGPLIRFWMFSGTLLGWYRQCDIIPYTTDVDFASWIDDVDDLESIVKTLYDNKHLKMVERMGLVEEGLEFRMESHQLRVDVFFVYKNESKTWISIHRPGKSFFIRMYYPLFDLCSANLLGEKVNVPCQAEEVIVTEYGPNWTRPIRSWDYDESPFNLGEKRYWNESQKTQAFVTYS